MATTSAIPASIRLQRILRGICVLLGKDAEVRRRVEVHERRATSARRMIGSNSCGTTEQEQNDDRRQPGSHGSAHWLLLVQNTQRQKCWAVKGKTYSAFQRK